MDVGESEDVERVLTRGNASRGVEACRGIRPPQHLDAIVAEIDDPVLGDSGGRVDRPLGETVLGRRSVGNLDHQDRSRGVLQVVVGVFPRDDGEVRLGNGMSSDDEWKLNS